MAGLDERGDIAATPLRGVQTQPRVDDSRAATDNYEAPAICPVCEAIKVAGRWQWRSGIHGAHMSRCPACQRIHDRRPGGTLTISGCFHTEHREEIYQLIQKLESTEKAQYPLDRIIEFREEADETVVSFTSARLAGVAGKAMREVYHGYLQYRWADGSKLLQVIWHRPQ